jgi:hypothetical protein
MRKKEFIFDKQNFYQGDYETFNYYFDNTEEFLSFMDLLSVTLRIEHLEKQKENNYKSNLFPYL